MEVKNFLIKFNLTIVYSNENDYANMFNNIIRTRNKPTGIKATMIPSAIVIGEIDNEKNGVDKINFHLKKTVPNMLKKIEEKVDRKVTKRDVVFELERKKSQNWEEIIRKIDRNSGQHYHSDESDEDDRRLRSRYKNKSTGKGRTKSNVKGNKKKNLKI